MPLRRYHPVVWAVVAVHFLAALSFSLLVPMFRSPDEAQHVDMIRQYRFELGHDRPDEMVPQGADVTEADRSVADPAVRPRPPLVVERAVPRPERPSFSDLAAPNVPSTTDNHLTQHPPVFYAAVAGSTTFLAGLTPSGWWSWDREVFLYRFVAVLLTSPLPLLAAEAAMATGLSRRVGAVAASVVLLVPQATVVGASVNNDALVMLGAALAVVGSMRFLRSGRAADAWLAAAAGAVAALSKATAAPVLAWVVVVVVVATWGRWRSREVRRALIGTAVATGVGASWYVRNLVRFNDIQPTGFRERAAPADHEGSVSAFVPRWLDRLSQSFWGLPGRRSGVGLPAPLSHGLTAGAVLLALVALADAARRRATILLLLLTVSQVVLLAQTNWRAHLRTGAYPAIQGRYLFAVLVPLAVLCVIGARQLRRRWPARPSADGLPSTVGVAWSVAAVGAVLHLVLALSMLRSYWGAPRSGSGDRLAAVVAWSPLPALMTRGVLALLVLATIAVAVAAVSAVLGPLVQRRRDRSTRRPPRRGDTTQAS